jgi:hypothetical protein
MYPLPDAEAQRLEFQTKCTLAPFMDNYEITADGRLLHETCETRWEDDPSAPLGCVIHRDNLRWEPVAFRGQLEIHTVHDGRWYAYLFWFKDGRVADLQHGPGHGESIPRVVARKAD